LESCLLDFDLTDEGTFRLKRFGERTADEILERGYPVLSKALENEAFDEHSIESAADPQQFDSAAVGILRKAVESAHSGDYRTSQRPSASARRFGSLC